MMGTGTASDTLAGTGCMSIAEKTEEIVSLSRKFLALLRGGR